MQKRVLSYIGIALVVLLLIIVGFWGEITGKAVNPDLIFEGGCSEGVGEGVFIGECGATDANRYLYCESQSTFVENCDLCGQCPSGLGCFDGVSCMDVPENSVLLKDMNQDHFTNGDMACDAIEQNCAGVVEYWEHPTNGYQWTETSIDCSTNLDEANIREENIYIASCKSLSSDLESCNSCIGEEYSWCDGGDIGLGEFCFESAEDCSEGDKIEDSRFKCPAYTSTILPIVKNPNDFRASCEVCTEEGFSWCDGENLAISSKCGDGSASQISDCSEFSGSLIINPINCAPTYEGCTTCVSNENYWCTDVSTNDFVAKNYENTCVDAVAQDTCQSGTLLDIVDITNCPDYVEPDDDEDDGSNDGSNDDPSSSGGDSPYTGTRPDSNPSTTNPSNNYEDESTTERRPLTIGGKEVKNLLVDKWFWIIFLGSIALIVALLLVWRYIRQRVLNPAN